MTLLIDHQDDIAGVLGDQPIALFALAQRQAGVLTVGDILNLRDKVERLIARIAHQ